MKLTEKQELEVLRAKCNYDLMVKENKSGNIYLQAKRGIKFSGNFEREALLALFNDKTLQQAISYFVSQLD